MEKGASSPFAQAKRTDFQVLRKGAARPFSIGRISPQRREGAKPMHRIFNHFQNLTITTPA
jgi:hypothetical protein